MSSKLSQELNNLRQDIQRDREGRQSLIGRLSEESASRAVAVEQMLDKFHEEHLDACDRLQDEIDRSLESVFNRVSEIRQEVQEARRAFQEDLTQARAAWQGVGGTASAEALTKETSSRRRVRR
jgi:ElaB/YqjD/DUF883 family membrane-anchored ribosome-binding protein